MAKIRKQVIKAGKMLEVDYFPCHEISGRRIGEKPKSQKSKAKMDEENKNKAVRKFVRLVNANFDENDFFATFDYQPELAPFSYERAQKDIYNYINRVRYLRKKKGLDNKNFRAAWTIQEVVYKRGYFAGLCNYHCHMFITSDGLTAKELKELWPYGTKGNINNYDPYRFGPEAAAKYMTKTHAGRRMYKTTKNMKQPVIEERKDGNMSERKLREIAEQRKDDADYWEKKYPSYRFVRCRPFYNEYNGHWYITVIMYKKTDNKSYYDKSRKRAIEKRKRIHEQGVKV